MPTQFERTTVSFTRKQMEGMKKLVENGEYPDLTEATRAAVDLFLLFRRFPPSQPGKEWWATKTKAAAKS